MRSSEAGSLIQEFLVGVIMVGVAHLAFAEDETAPTHPQAETPVAEFTSHPLKVKSKKRGGARSEKEADGTEAKNRFQADTVIKSKYQLDGQNLEVDPD